MTKEYITKEELRTLLYSLVDNYLDELEENQIIGDLFVITGKQDYSGSVTYRGGFDDGGVISVPAVHTIRSNILEFNFEKYRILTGKKKQIEGNLHYTSVNRSFLNKLEGEEE